MAAASTNQAKRKTAYSTNRERRFTRKEAEDFLTQKNERRTMSKGTAQAQFSLAKPSKGVSKRTQHAMAYLAPEAAGQQDGFGAGMNEEQKQEAKELEEHLISISPFNRRWNITKTINAGSYGVVFAVEDNLTNTPGVIKVSRAGDGVNSAVEWESFILERIFKTDPNANIVRLLDKGMLQDQYDQQLEFVVLEQLQPSIKDYLEDFSDEERLARVCRIGLGSLKAVFDLHNQGLLHRDIKPDNMGYVIRNGLPIALMFDLGTARMFSDGLEDLRPPRTTVYFAGTEEWASGHAAKWRDQTRYDDLISWMYAVVELFNPDSKTLEPFPWDFVNNPKGMRHLKSTYSPARLLLKHCPRQIYAINTYLQCANRLRVPDYGFIANLMGEAMTDYELKMEVSKKEKKQRRSSIEDT